VQKDGNKTKKYAKSAKLHASLVSAPSSDLRFKQKKRAEKTAENTKKMHKKMAKRSR
jgi:hypothetical protein